MQRKKLWLPRECLSRPIEHLKKSEDYILLRVKGELNGVLFSFATSVIRPYHFDNIADFLDNEQDLKEGIPLVFPELEVNAVKKEKKAPRLEFILGDNSGTLKAIYEWTPNLGQAPGKREEYKSEGLDLTINPFNNPLFGAEIGDRLRIYSATYEARGMIRLDPLRVLNDMHYRRIMDQHASISIKYGCSSVISSSGK